MTFIRLLMSNRWAQGLALVAAVIALLFALDRCAQYAMSAATRSATEAGVQQERANTAHKSLNQVEKANAAAETVRRNGGADFDKCLRDNRHPESC